MADQVHWYLECINKEKNVKKFYEVFLEKESGDRYTIRIQHGRIGRAPRPFTPSRGLTYSVAKNQAISIVEGKLAKGYVEVKKPNTGAKKAAEEPAPQPEGRFGRIIWED